MRESGPRVAIVGAGLMGRWHAHAAVKAGGRVAAVVDRNQAAAASLAGRHRGARRASRLDEVVDGLDVVHVCTSSESHPALVEQALAAGLHVLVEKPLAFDALETSRLLSLADARGVLLCPVHQFLFQRGVQSAIARTPALAPLQHVQISICSAGASGLDAAARDRVAWDILPHALSVLLRVNPGDWTVWRGLRPAPGELRLMGLSRTVTAGVTISMSGRPPHNELQVIGAAGTMEADLFHGFSVYDPPDVSRWRKISRPLSLASRTLLGAGVNLTRRALARELAYPGLDELVRRFYAAARGLVPTPIPPAETLAVARHLDAIRRVIEQN